MRYAPRIPLTALLMAFALGGCAAAQQTSTGKFSGDAKGVAQTVDDLQTAGNGHDQGKICRDLLASSLVGKLNQATGGCNQAVKNQLDDTDVFDATIASTSDVSIRGNLATARVKSTRSGHSHVYTLTMVRESGRWKISGMSG